MRCVAVTEDRPKGLFDRPTSLPIPRSSVLAGQALADAAVQVWALLVMIAVG